MLDHDVMNTLLENSVKGLKEFGYSNVNKENIFTDEIYSAFFKRMLENAKGNGVDLEINHLINRIN